MLMQHVSNRPFASSVCVLQLLAGTSPDSHLCSTSTAAHRPAML